jgi:hypothetical protein
MKRIFLILVAALAATALVAGTGAASDTRGPACTNIVFGDGFYITRDGDGNLLANPMLQWRVDFGEPNCSEVTTLYVYDSSDTEKKPLVKLKSKETGSTSITFTYTFNQVGGAAAPADENVCLVATTDWSGHVADRAPDSGCAIVSGDGGPASGFN